MNPEIVTLLCDAAAKHQCVISYSKTDTSEVLSLDFRETLTPETPPTATPEPPIYLTAVEHLTTADMEKAAADGDIERMKQLHEQGCPMNWVAPSAAAAYGQLQALRYLHEELKCPWNHMTITRALINKQEACLRYAFEHDCP